MLSSGKVVWANVNLQVYISHYNPTNRKRYTMNLSPKYSVPLIIFRFLMTLLIEG